MLSEAGCVLCSLPSNGSCKVISEESASELVEQIALSEVGMKILEEVIQTVPVERIKDRNAEQMVDISQCLQSWGEIVARVQQRIDEQLVEVQVPHV